jgi:hypothetical protein
MVPVSNRHPGSIQMNNIFWIKATLSDMVNKVSSGKEGVK